MKKFYKEMLDKKTKNFYLYSATLYFIIGFLFNHFFLKNSKLYSVLTATILIYLIYFILPVYIFFIVYLRTNFKICLSSEGVISIPGYNHLKINSYAKKEPISESYVNTFFKYRFNVSNIKAIYFLKYNDLSKNEIQDFENQGKINNYNKAICITFKNKLNTNDKNIANDFYSQKIGFSLDNPEEFYNDVIEMMKKLDVSNNTNAG